jgi:hypothetical protein
MHQGRNVGLLNAQNCARFELCEGATFDDAADLQSEMGLELLASGLAKGISANTLPLLSSNVTLLRCCAAMRVGPLHN